MKPTLEILEDRTVPSVIENPHLDLIFVGPNPYQSQIVQLEQLAATQVGPRLLAADGVGVGYVGAIDVVGAPATGVLDDNGATGYPTQVQQIILGEIAAGRVPVGPDEIYMVFGAPGVFVNQPGIGPFVGYHSAYTDGTYGTIKYGVIPYPGSPNASDGGGVWATLQHAATHEDWEAITNYTTVTPDEGGEVSDKFNGIMTQLDGVGFQVVEGPDGNEINLQNAPNPPTLPPLPPPPPPQTPWTFNDPNPFDVLVNDLGWIGQIEQEYLDFEAQLWSEWESLVDSWLSLEAQLFQGWGGFGLSQPDAAHAPAVA